MQECHPPVIIIPVIIIIVIIITIFVIITNIITIEKSHLGLPDGKCSNIFLLLHLLPGQTPFNGSDNSDDGDDGGDGDGGDDGENENVREKHLKISHSADCYDESSLLIAFLMAALDMMILIKILSKEIMRMMMMRMFVMSSIETMIA